jgi:hypothetical protein
MCPVLRLEEVEGDPAFLTGVESSQESSQRVNTATTTLQVTLHIRNTSP